MLWRALLAFVALPGVVAFALPLSLARAATPVHPAALALVVAGTALLLACAREFYVAGRGTLAPWSPPRHLVVTGAYRFSRNPMYLAVALVLAGWATLYASSALWTYGGAVVVLFHLRVLLFEEPWLTRTFGGEWDRYRERVPRWLV
jgi:protein-S-isoprenylcysteine O-methyltransferase Ste14